MCVYSVCLPAGVCVFALQVMYPLPPPSLVPVAPSRTAPVLSVAEAVVDSSRW